MSAELKIASLESMVDPDGMVSEAALIERESFPELQTTTAGFQLALAEPRASLLLAYRYVNGVQVLVGYCLYQCSSMAGRIVKLAVRADERQAGVGGKRPPPTNVTHLTYL